MNIQRLQGLALILSALTGALLLLPFMKYLTFIFSNLFEVIRIISAMLFIMGLSAIKTIQPQTKKSWSFRMRKWWTSGLIFMAIPAFQKIISGLTIIFAIDLESYIWVGLGFFVVIAYSGGYLLAGWLTTQTRVFPVWVGWILIITGIFDAAILVFIIYLPANWLPPVINTYPLTVLGTLLESTALAGYGWTIFNHQKIYPTHHAKATL